MQMMERLFMFVCALGALALAAGCTPVGVAVGAGAAAGSMAMEERSMEDSLNDRRIALDINRALADEDGSLFRNVGVDVVEGRVLLTGAVSSPDERVAAVRIAWSVEDVEEVLNEIQVTEDGDLVDVSRDTLTKTRLTSKITLDRQIYAVNYDISVVNNVVYLFGLAQSEAEVDRVIAHARDVPYVRRVVSHMRLVDDPARKTRTAPDTDEQES